MSGRSTWVITSTTTPWGGRAGWGARIYPYLGGKGNWRIFVCPSDPYSGSRDLTDRTSNGFQGTGASYGFNHGWQANKPGLGMIHYDGSFSVWKRFSACMWASQTCLVSQLKPTASNPPPWPYGFLYHSWGAPIYNPIHNRNINVLYCDGHVDSQDPFGPLVSPGMDPWKTPEGKFWYMRW